jgi:hypothetical protein
VQEKKEESWMGIVCVSSIPVIGTNFWW